MRADADAGHVVLLPGLWMPAWVMLPLRYRLARCGFACTCFGYASASAGLDANVARLARSIETCGSDRVHLVGHSLGGALALHATASHALRRVHRVVMMGSPYRDSYAARVLARSDIGRRMLGQTVPEWLSCPRLAIPPGVEVGVIAGTVAFGLGAIVARDMPRPHDGVIRVAETAVDGMKESIEVAVSHSHLLLSKSVGRLVCSFLRHGQFAVEAPAAEPVA